MDLDSDESMPYPNKQYIDPWDLENYAYIRQHLDSVDLSSDPSSLGEPQETSAFYYIPARPLELPPTHQDDESIYYHHRTMGGERLEKIYDTQHSQHSQYNQDAEYYYTMRKVPTVPTTRYDTIARSERDRGLRGGMAGSYAAIDELLIRNEIASSRRHRRASHAGSIYGGSLPVQPPAQQYGTYVRRGSGSKVMPREDIYEQYNYEPTETDLYGIPENTSMQIYEKNKTLRRQHQMSKNDGPVAKMAKSRSHSFSVGDLEYDSYRTHQSIYNDDQYMRSDIYDSTGSSPIYDDIRSSLSHRPKPKHFKLSNYGHLKIDYSFSWNNLNKYIYN
ncbi:uncharacterized protein [Atheta coriaria]|uniref:uncharacterized protein n=1 Tax=Dalotia coriaria TaxID=877792 RepID=UPI0031F39DB4